MTETAEISYETVIPNVLGAMAHVHQVMAVSEGDKLLHHLILLRVSQINRCGHCVKMHTRDARKAGATDAQLDRLAVWDQVNDFSEREKAAFAWAEALTNLTPPHDFGDLRARLRQYFSETEIGLLTATTAMINLWNRINVSKI